jgi:hypothetical protein
LKIEDFIKCVSTEKKRTILKSLNGENGIAITAIKLPQYIYNNLYKSVREFVTYDIVEECGLTPRSTKSTFPNQASKYRLTSRGKEILKILDSIEKK